MKIKKKFNFMILIFFILIFLLDSKNNLYLKKMGGKNAKANRVSGYSNPNMPGLLPFGNAPFGGLPFGGLPFGAPFGGAPCGPIGIYIILIEIKVFIDDQNYYHSLPFCKDVY